jgi:hypothetical protein
VDIGIGKEIIVLACDIAVLVGLWMDEEDLIEDQTTNQTT